MLRTPAQHAGEILSRTFLRLRVICIHALSLCPLFFLNTFYLRRHPRQERPDTKLGGLFSFVCFLLVVCFFFFFFWFFVVFCVFVVFGSFYSFFFFFFCGEVLFLECTVTLDIRKHRMDFNLRSSTTNRSTH